MFPYIFSLEHFIFIENHSVFLLCLQENDESKKSDDDVKTEMHLVVENEKNQITQLPQVVFITLLHLCIIISII